MIIDVLTYYPAMIDVTRLRVEENGRRDIIGPGPQPLPRIGRKRVSSLNARENRASIREEPHTLMYENAKRNFRSNCATPSGRVLVLPVLKTMPVGEDSTVKY